MLYLQAPPGSPEADPQRVPHCSTWHTWVGRRLTLFHGQGEVRASQGSREPRNHEDAHQASEGRVEGANCGRREGNFSASIRLLVFGFRLSALLFLKLFFD